MKLKITLSLLIISTTAFCKIWVVNNSGAFSPATLTITEGDTVNFVLNSAHNAVEVSQSTWDSNNNTPIWGGFVTSFGGDTVFPAQLSVGTHYYVCEPHASSGMKGQITVQAATGLTVNSVSNISVYPNPINDLMTIKTNKNSLGSSYTMLDLTGRQVLTGRLQNETLNIDVSQLHSGVYFIQVGADTKQIFKVIKR